MELGPKLTKEHSRSHPVPHERPCEEFAPLYGARRLHTGPAGINSELNQSAVATIRFTEIRRRNPLTRTILEYLHTYLGELASQRGRRKRMTRSSASCSRQ